jgi:hypothetical protein
MSATYALMDTETDNLVGSFSSQTAALQAVAATARRFGQDAPEVLSLMLFREDGPEDEGYVAEGKELVRLALTTPIHTSARKSKHAQRATVESGSMPAGKKHDKVR